MRSVLWTSTARARGRVLGRGRPHRAHEAVQAPVPTTALVDLGYAPAGLSRKWVVLAGLRAAPFLAVLDGFIVTIAAPSIQDQLHASDAGVQLVVAGYV